MGGGGQRTTKRERQRQREIKREVRERGDGKEGRLWEREEEGEKRPQEVGRKEDRRYARESKDRGVTQIRSSKQQSHP